MREHYYYIDKEGRIFFQGMEMNDPWLQRLFHRLLKETDDGRLVVVCEGELCYVEAEDAPYVVSDVKVSVNGEGQIEQIELFFPGGYKNILNPSTLFVGKENVLYCRVRNGRFPCRFNRKSYYCLASYVNYDEISGEFYIEVKGERYLIGGLKASEHVNVNP